MPRTPAGEMLRKAADLVDGPREHDHGEKQASFEGIARTWNVYLENKWQRTLDNPINAVDVAQFMVLLKMTRPQFGAYSADHALDQCGYSGIVGQLAAHAHDSESSEGESLVVHAPPDFYPGGLQTS
jgi:hypothetical protein